MFVNNVSSLNLNNFAKANFGQSSSNGSGQQGGTKPTPPPPSPTSGTKIVHTGGRGPGRTN